MKYTTLDCNNLSKVNTRLQQAKNSMSVFGGLSIITCGDNHQFEPVKGLTIGREYDDTHTSATHAGRSLFVQISQKCIILDKNFRSLSDPVYLGIQQRFLQGKVTFADCDLLNENTVSNYRPTEQNTFIPISVTLIGTDLPSDELMDLIVTKYNLATRQANSFRMVARHFLLEESAPLLFHFGGVAGTGKSHVVLAISKLFEICQKPELFMKVSYMGCAASLIGGSSICQELCLMSKSITLSVNDDNLGKIMDTFRINPSRD